MKPQATRIKLRNYKPFRNPRRPVDWELVASVILVFVTSWLILWSATS